MGSKARILVYTDSEDEAVRGAEAAFDVIERLEQTLSDYRVTSEVSALKSVRPGEWAPISTDLFNTLRVAHDVWTRTEGAFDVTLRPLTGLWREAGKTGTRPSDERLDRAHRSSGFDKLELRAANEQFAPAVRFHSPGMSLDFGGIGKGLAAQAALDELASLGLTIAMVDLGGDLAVGEPPPGRNGWRISVQTGLDEHREILVTNRSVATSGDTERSSVIDGVRYAHIIDPRTGEPLTTRRAATVIHPDGAIADALASAACVLGRSGPASLRTEFPEAVITVVESSTTPPTLRSATSQPEHAAQ